MNEPTLHTKQPPGGLETHPPNLQHEALRHQTCDCFVSFGCSSIVHGPVILFDVYKAAFSGISSDLL